MSDFTVEHHRRLNTISIKYLGAPVIGLDDSNFTLEANGNEVISGVSVMAPGVYYFPCLNIGTKITISKNKAGEKYYINETIIIK